MSKLKNESSNIIDKVLLHTTISKIIFLMVILLNSMIE